MTERDIDGAMLVVGAWLKRLTADPPEIPKGTDPKVAAKMLAKAENEREPSATERQAMLDLGVGLLKNIAVIAEAASILARKHGDNSMGTK